MICCAQCTELSLGTVSSSIFLTAKGVLHLEIWEGRYPFTQSPPRAMFVCQLLEAKCNWVGRALSPKAKAYFEWWMGWGLRGPGRLHYSRSPKYLLKYLFNGAWSSIINNAFLCAHHHPLCERRFFNMQIILGGTIHLCIWVNGSVWITIFRLFFLRGHLENKTRKMRIATGILYPE